jgi:hypothetical protein
VGSIWLGQELQLQPPAAALVSPVLSRRCGRLGCRSSLCGRRLIVQHLADDASERLPRRAPEFARLIAAIVIPTHPPQGTDNTVAIALRDANAASVAERCASTIGGGRMTWRIPKGFSRIREVGAAAVLRARRMG